MQHTSAFYQLKMQVTRQLKRNLLCANNYFNTQFPMPTVNYQIKGVKAGVAYLQKNEIRLNPILLMENGNDFIQQVVPHELAHLIVFQKFGKVKPHGKEWKMVMVEVLSVPPHIYHCFDTRNVRPKQYPYRCHCQIHYLSSQRHYAVQQNKRSYYCRLCQKPLILQHNSIQTD